MEKSKIKIYRSTKGNSKICAVIQTDFGYKKVSKLCEHTWKDLFLEKGYDICYIDFTLDDKTYVQNLLSPELKIYDYIITMFDDLFFYKINIPKADDLFKATKEYNIDYIRFDGRPPNISEQNIIINKVKYFKIDKVKKYVFSTVLACFKKDLLSNFSELGLASAWDIEKLNNIDNIKAYAPNHRTADYRNVIVKGKIDVFQLIFIKGTHISFYESLKKIIFRGFKKLFN